MAWRLAEPRQRFKSVPNVRFGWKANILEVLWQAVVIIMRLFIAPPIAAFLLASCQDAGSYAEQCHASLDHWRKQSEGMNHHAIPIHVRMDAHGVAKWNGEKVTDAKLVAYLGTARQMNPLRSSF